MSREKQIDEMAKIICDFPQCINYNCIGECKPTECQITDKAEVLYNAGYRKQEWISVDERLPEREGKYIAYTTRGTIEIARFYSYYVNDKPQFDYWITHWMPLPEAPEMKGESDG